MTATAAIVTADRDNVLLVPNAALRFTPPTRDEAAETQLSRQPAARPPPEPAKKRPQVAQKAGEARSGCCG
jgi:HlyD family secretion protein